MVILQVTHSYLTKVRSGSQAVQVSAKYMRSKHVKFFLFFTSSLQVPYSEDGPSLCSTTYFWYKLCREF